jgi:hypothetical protein
MGNSRKVPREWKLNGAKKKRSGIRTPMTEETAPPIPKNKETGCFRLVTAFERIGYPEQDWHSLIDGLMQYFQTTEAAATFVETLAHAGWNAQTLKRAMRANAQHQRIGTPRILLLQMELIETHGFNQKTAIHILSRITDLLELTPNELSIRIRAALGKKMTRSQVFKLLENASDAIVYRDEVWLELIRDRCARGRVDVRRRPYHLVIELNKELRTDVSATENATQSAVP